MKAICITLCFFFFSALVIAQEVNERKNYYIFYSNSEINYCERIEYKKPVLGSSYFLIDSQKVDPSRIMFYREGRGFWANTKNLSSSGVSGFVPRIIKGNINLYEKEVYGQHAPSPTGFGFSGGMGYKRIHNYYNIGFNELKKANYKNLNLDLADNAESMLHLNKYKSLRNTETGLYVAGGALVVLGFATIMHKTKDWDGTDEMPEPNVTANVVVFFTGGICIGTGALINLSKPKHLRKAIEVYNR
jgi:hypothetical protein